MNVSLRSWTPARLAFEAASWKVNWCLPGEGAYFGSPFWSEDVSKWTRHPFNLLFGLSTGLDALGSLALESPGMAPSGLIFHLSRCGSTLLSQMLASSERNLVVSEGVPLDVALRARSFDASLPEEAAQSLLRNMTSVLGRPRRESETRFFLKLDAWHLLEWRRFAGLFPGVPWTVVWRDPVEILVSHARRPGMQMRPEVLAPSLFGLSANDARDETSYRAQVLGRLAQSAVDALEGWSGGCALAYSSLPRGAFRLIETHFGVGLSREECAGMEAATRVHAKAPRRSFQPDTPEKQAQATPDQRAACERFASPWTGKLLDFSL